MTTPDYILLGGIALNCVTMVEASRKKRWALTLIAMALADVCIIVLLHG